MDGAIGALLKQRVTKVFKDRTRDGKSYFARKLYQIATVFAGGEDNVSHLLTEFRDKYCADAAPPGPTKDPIVENVVDAFNKCGKRDHKMRRSYAQLVVGQYTLSTLKRTYGMAIGNSAYYSANKKFRDGGIQSVVAGPKLGPKKLSTEKCDAAQAIWKSHGKPTPYARHPDDLALDCSIGEAVAEIMDAGLMGETKARKMMPKNIKKAKAATDVCEWCLTYRVRRGRYVKFVERLMEAYNCATELDLHRARLAGREAPAMSSPPRDRAKRRLNTCT